MQYAQTSSDKIQDVRLWGVKKELAKTPQHRPHSLKECEQFVKLLPATRGQTDV